MRFDSFVSPGGPKCGRDYVRTLNFDVNLVRLHTGADISSRLRTGGLTLNGISILFWSLMK